MGRKFKLGRHPKNGERRKGAIRLESFVVSLPLDLYDLCCSLDCLGQRLGKRDDLPTGWSIEASSERLTLSQLDTSCSVPDVRCSLVISSDFSWRAYLYGKEVSPVFCQLLSSTDRLLRSVCAVVALVKCLHESHACIGNGDDKFQELPQTRKGVFLGKHNAVAFVESRLLGTSTVRHSRCGVAVKRESSRCQECSTYRRTLNIMVTRLKNSADKENRTAPSSKVNYCHLSTPEKDKRLSRLHSLLRSANRRIARLEARLEEAAATSGVTLDTQTHSDLKKIMDENFQTILDNYAPDSFVNIFWQQQMKAATVKSAPSMRWHPLMVKWCLHIRHLSSGAYEELRKSGCLSLPSQRTLRDYTHYASAKSGFSMAVDYQLINAAQIETCGERRKCVTLLMDEMYIKQDLVYDKTSGALTGFTDLSDVNNHLAAFQRSLEGGEAFPQILARSMLMLMVRGMFDGLQFPYAQFACTTVKADQMFHIVWATVRRLERDGFRVMALTCDGIAANRQLFRLHSSKQSTLVYKTGNPYSKQPRNIYFLSDPPHLLKTARNCLANKNRHLWVWFDQPISWSHVSQLYYDATAGKEAPGLSLATKLKYEHVHLTSFSKMRVDLAVQVLSSTVSKALMLRYGSRAAATARFAEIMDGFFDCMNVANYTDGKHHRKPFQEPYHSCNDARFEWLESTFLRYFSSWESAVKSREGFSDAEKKLMLLSTETMTGLRLTAKAFIELAKNVLSLPGTAPLLSRRLSQDPLEKYFGLQRQRGRVNDNPTVVQFFKNAQALRVASACATSIKGNCRGNKDVDKAQHQKLNRRKSHS